MFLIWPGQLFIWRHLSNKKISTQPWLNEVVLIIHQLSSLSNNNPHYPPIILIIHQSSSLSTNSSHHPLIILIIHQLSPLSTNSLIVLTGADPNLPDCNGLTPHQLKTRAGRDSPSSEKDQESPRSPRSPRSPSSDQGSRTPTTPKYAALDWSHHGGKGERRGAASVQHTELRPQVAE